MTILRLLKTWWPDRWLAALVGTALPVLTTFCGCSCGPSVSRPIDASLDSGPIQCVQDITPAELGRCGVCVRPHETPVRSSDNILVHDDGLLGAPELNAPPWLWFVSEAGTYFEFRANGRIADGPIPPSLMDQPLVSHAPALLVRVPGSARVWVVDRWSGTLGVPGSVADSALFDLSAANGIATTSWRETTGFVRDAAALSDGSLVLHEVLSFDTSTPPPNIVRVRPNLDGSVTTTRVASTDIGLDSKIDYVWRLVDDRIVVIGTHFVGYGRGGVAGLVARMVVLNSDLTVNAAAVDLADSSGIEFLINEFPSLYRATEEWDGSHTIVMKGALDVDPTPALMANCWVNRMNPDGTFLVAAPGTLINPTDYSTSGATECATFARSQGTTGVSYSVMQSPTGMYEWRAVQLDAALDVVGPYSTTPCGTRTDGDGAVFELCSSTGVAGPYDVYRLEAGDARTSLGPAYVDRCSTLRSYPVVYGARTDGLWIMYYDQEIDSSGHTVEFANVTRMHSDGRIGWTTVGL